MRGLSLIVLLIGGMVLAGCVSGRPKGEAYVDRKGVVRIIESDRELCTRSCNEDYDRCDDSEPAQRSPIDATNNAFGAGADCTRDLSSCLANCKNR